MKMFCFVDTKLNTFDYLGEDWALSPITENRDKLKDRGRSGKGLLACQPDNLVYGVTFTVGYNDCKS